MKIVTHREISTLDVLVFCFLLLLFFNLVGSVGVLAAFRLFRFFKFRNRIHFIT